MKIFQYTNKGSREENQDFVIHGSLPDNSAVFVVADGMGGHRAGNIASEMTVTDLGREWINTDYTELSQIQYKFHFCQLKLSSTISRQSEF